MVVKRLRNESNIFLYHSADDIDWLAATLNMGNHKQILFIGDQHCHEFLSEAISLLNPDVVITYSPGVMGAFLYLTEIDKRKFPQLVIADLDTMSMNADSIAGLIQSIPNVINTVFMFLSKNLESWDISFWEKHGVTLFEKPFAGDEYRKVAQTIVYSII